MMETAVKHRCAGFGRIMEKCQGYISIAEGMAGMSKTFPFVHSDKKYMARALNDHLRHCGECSP